MMLFSVYVVAFVLLRPTPLEECLSAPKVLTSLAFAALAGKLGYWIQQQQQQQYLSLCVKGYTSVIFFFRAVSWLPLVQFYGGTCRVRPGLGRLGTVVRQTDAFGSTPTPLVLL